MSILIRGMEMPTEGGTIVVYKISGKFFAARAGRNELFPLVPVPLHGKLIDADSKTFPTLHRNPSNDYMKGWNACLRSVQQQPTIIPAEEDE